MKSVIFAVLLFASVHLGSGWLVFRKDPHQSGLQPVTDECVRKAEEGQCEFYQCFDERHQCSYHNYVLNYGLPYCQKFRDQKHRLTEKAKRWIEETDKCVMKRLLEVYQQQSQICESTELFAKHVYAKCSTEHGFCDPDLLWQNKEVLLDIYKPSRRAAVRFLMNVKHCGVRAAVRITAWLLPRLSMLAK